MSEYATEDFDLERFVELFDNAMNSDNPAVQKCLKNLLLVVTLVHAEDKTLSIGPLQKIVHDVRDLQQRMIKIEYEKTRLNTPFNNPYLNTWTTTTGNGYVAPNSGAYSTVTFH